MNYITIIILTLIVASCAVQDIKKECNTKVIDQDRKFLLTVIPHDCNARISIESSQRNVKVEHKEGVITVIGLSNYEFNEEKKDDK